MQVLLRWRLILTFGISCRICGVECHVSRTLWVRCFGDCVLRLTDSLLLPSKGSPTDMAHPLQINDQAKQDRKDEGKLDVLNVNCLHRDVLYARTVVIRARIPSLKYGNNLSPHPCYQRSIYFATLIGRQLTALSPRRYKTRASWLCNRSEKIDVLCARPLNF